MRILGIDPGIAIVGWGILDYENSKFKTIDYGSIQTPSDMSTPERLVMIDEGLKQIIDTYKPEHLSIEELFWNTNQTTGIRVAEARGVILARCHKEKLKINEYTPLQVKQAVVGYGRADKKQVISMVTMLLKLQKPPKPDDTADALALAICHAHTGGSAISKYYNLK